ncbi:ABC transporter ATP-binding protein [bacterium]|nr:ABC transporter ATP-binding protein [bacterium]
MNVIEFNHVWKKFQKGDKLYSLRDAIPNLFQRSKPLNRDNGILSNDEFLALRNVTFQVKKGSVLGIIGPNGAGKSTILKLLSRIIKPTQGEINIKGKLSALIEITAGFHPEFTGRENIYFNGAILGMSKKDIERKFDSIVEFSGIEEFIDTPVKRYSSGMYTRLGFSVAAHIDPDIMLVDEVLAVGDMAFKAKCAHKMRELLDSGVTIVLVSHHLSLVQNLCKRVILIDKGTALKEGTPEEIIPYYRNIVYDRREEELKKKGTSDGYKIKLKEDPFAKISNIFLYDGKDKQADSFLVGESLSVKIEYETKAKIENPIFYLEIIRADGILCCSASTKNDGFPIESIQGKGSIELDLGEIILVPGIYFTKVGIWDKEMIHPYAIREDGILKIEVTDSTKHMGGIFAPKVLWKR